MNAKEKVNTVELGWEKYYYKIMWKTYNKLKSQCGFLTEKENNYEIKINKK